MKSSKLYLLLFVLIFLIFIFFSNLSVKADDGIFKDSEYTNVIFNPSNKKRQFDYSKFKITQPKLVLDALGNYSLDYSYGVPNEKGGSQRYVEFRMKFSREFEKTIQSVSVEPSDNVKVDNNVPSKYKGKTNFERVETAPDGGNIYINNIYLDKYHGGSGEVSVKLKPKFIDQDSKIYAYMRSDTLSNFRVWPIFDALRIFDYDNFGSYYNSRILAEQVNSSQNNINKVKKNIDSQVNDSQYSYNTKQRLLNKINSIYNSGVNRINNQTEYVNSTLDNISKIEKDTVNEINNALNGVSELEFNQVPDMNFGVRKISSQNTIFPLLSPIKLIVNSLNNSTGWKIDLSISNLVNDQNGYILPATYIMNNINYSPNITFNYYDSGKAKNGKISIDKNINDGPKVYVPSGQQKEGNYMGNATWTIRQSPI